MLRFIKSLFIPTYDRHQQRLGGRVQSKDGAIVLSQRGWTFDTRKLKTAVTEAWQDFWTDPNPFTFDSFDFWTPLYE